MKKYRGFSSRPGHQCRREPAATAFFCSMTLPIRTNIVILLTILSAAMGASDPGKVAEEIRAEATRANFSDVGWPLPLAGHWNTGTLADGFSPDWQLQML